MVFRRIDASLSRATLTVGGVLFLCHLASCTVDVEALSGGSKGTPSSAGARKVDAKSTGEGGAQGLGGTEGQTLPSAGTGGVAGASESPCVYYADADGDGYGDDDKGINVCTLPSGYSVKAGDCNDSDPAVHEGATELCDAVDNDCNSNTLDACDAFCAGSLLQNRSYMMCKTEMSYDQASKVCDSHKMKLARINDALENVFIQGLQGSLGFIWLGATDALKEGTWLFADGTPLQENGVPAPGVYTNWSPNEPSNAAPGEHCLTMWGGGQWNDYVCSSKGGFACERY